MQLAIYLRSIYLHIVMGFSDIAFLVFVQAQNGISISSFPSPLYFKTGDSLSIICEYTGNLVFQHWLHPTDGIIAASQGRKTIQVFDTIIFLTIIDAQESDGGDYRCIFSKSMKQKSLKKNSCIS